MILTILGVIAFPLWLWMISKDSKDEGLMCVSGILIAIIGAFLTVIMAILILIAHIGVDATIEENRIEYESLCERYEIVTSEYEDVSKSDVIKDIAEWNKDVYSTKHWANNPWTNWFYSKRVADELKMIERRTNSGKEN